MKKKVLTLKSLQKEYLDITENQRERMNRFDNAITDRIRDLRTQIDSLENDLSELYKAHASSIYRELAFLVIICGLILWVALA